MKTCKEDPSVAQGAKEWHEHLLHEEVMTKIRGVSGWYSLEEDYDLYPVKEWHENVLSKEEMEQIFERGESTEIVFLIKRYGELMQAKEKNMAVFEVPYQVKLASRNVPDEIDAYLSFQGFGPEGQAAFLHNASPEDVLRYVARHGFEHKQQRLLMTKSKENSAYKEALMMHIARHGLSLEIVVDMLVELEETGDTSFYYEFIERHEFSPLGQIAMLKTVKEPEFLAYINHYGLWNETHVSLVTLRSAGELKAYIERHHFLVPEAEVKLAEKRIPWLNMFYVHNHVLGTFPASDFLTALLSVTPLDYPAISAMLLSGIYIETHPRESADQDNDIIKNGTHEQIMALVTRGGTLALKNVAELFFRNNKEEFETYVSQCECSYYH